MAAGGITKTVEVTTGDLASGFLHEPGALFDTLAAIGEVRGAARNRFLAEFAEAHSGSEWHGSVPQLLQELLAAVQAVANG